MSYQKQGLCIITYTRNFGRKVEERGIKQRRILRQEVAAPDVHLHKQALISPKLGQSAHNAKAHLNLPSRSFPHWGGRVLVSRI